MISIICETFSCTPSEALAQDPTIIYAVLDYKMAEGVKRQFNDDASQMSVEQVKFMKKLNEELESG